MKYSIQSIIVIILVFLATKYALRAIKKTIYQIKKGEPNKLEILKSWKERLFYVVKLVFFQKKTFEEPSYGVMHMWYIYGFLILGIGHVEFVLHGATKFLKSFDKEPFLYKNISAVPEWSISLYALSQDFFATGVIMAATIALYKRCLGRTKRLLPRSKDAETILWLIVALYISLFIVSGIELLNKNAISKLAPEFLWSMPVSSIIAINVNGFSKQLLSISYNICWWTHLTLFLGFACYIPNSKHMHIIAAAPNIFLKKLNGIPAPETINFEIAEKFGSNSISDLKQKTLLDSFACTECGRCNAVCPANLTKKPLKPKKILHDIKINLKTDIKNIINCSKDFNVGQIALDEIWACTTCAACAEVCPVAIDSVPTTIINLRRHLVLMEAENYPKELNSLFRGLENQSNPWGVSQAKRLDWAENLEVPVASKMKDSEFDYLFWVGCSGSTDERAKKIQVSLVKILKKAKISFATLGCEEKCCGDPARRTGNEYLFDTLARENIETLSKYKFKKIITACPHCLNSIKNEYEDFGVKYMVQHHTELLCELIDEKKIEIKNKENDSIIFHDPCYLGRYNKKYKEPRNIINLLFNNVREASLNTKKSFCCGAGGGRMFMEEHIGKRINHERIDQLIEASPSIISTGCPFCMTMLSDGIRDKQLESSVKIKDIAELVAEKII